jgi:hypothetical protein
MNLNVDAILRTFSDENVRYLLIGGMNFFLRHRPETTFDVDLWVADDEENLARVNRALKSLGAEWGPTDAEWKSIPPDPSWLKRQACFCLTTAAGAVDIFREVHGLEQQFEPCFGRAVAEKTASGVQYRGLADVDMLRCQEALAPELRKESRVKTLRAALENGRNS